MTSVTPLWRPNTMRCNYISNPKYPHLRMVLVLKKLRLGHRQLYSPHSPLQESQGGKAPGSWLGNDKANPYELAKSGTFSGTKRSLLTKEKNSFLIQKDSSHLEFLRGSKLRAQEISRGHRFQLVSLASKSQITNRGWLPFWLRRQNSRSVLLYHSFIY